MKYHQTSITYQCTQCRSTRYEHFSAPGLFPFGSDNTGIRCLGCGHEKRTDLEAKYGEPVSYTVTTGPTVREY